jgi:hypothetical protein
MTACHIYWTFFSRFKYVQNKRILKITDIHGTSPQANYQPDFLIQISGFDMALQATICYLNFVFEFSQAIATELIANCRLK